MSRLGKKPVAIPEKVTISVADRVINVEGPLGKLTYEHRPEVSVTVNSDNNEVVVAANNESRDAKSFHGLTRALVANMLEGVSKGYEKRLEIVGVGKQRQARALLKGMKKNVAAASKGIKSRPKVMLLLGVGRTPFTMLSNSWGGDIVEKAGGELLTGGYSANSGFARISDEVVIAENPDVIIAVPHANASDIPSLTEYLRDNPAWQSTSAAQNGRVYVSVDNSLLQAGTDIARTIRKVRRAYLQN